MLLWRTASVLEIKSFSGTASTGHNYVSVTLDKAYTDVSYALDFPFNIYLAYGVYSVTDNVVRLEIYNRNTSTTQSISGKLIVYESE